MRKEASWYLRVIMCWSFFQTNLLDFFSFLKVKMAGEKLYTIEVIIALSSCCFVLLAAGQMTDPLEGSLPFHC